MRHYSEGKFRDLQSRLNIDIERHMTEPIDGQLHLAVIRYEDSCRRLYIIDAI
jgi:hypothetical protein